MSTLGPRNWYKYTGDDEKDYKIETQAYLAEAAGLELDDTPPILPKRITPRFVWVEAVELSQPKLYHARKKLVIQRCDVPKFAIGTIMKIDGVEMKVTSYRGESGRLGRNSVSITNAIPNDS
jgi:hypothetical protein